MGKNTNKSRVHLLTKKEITGKKFSSFLLFVFQAPKQNVQWQIFIGII